MSDVIDAETQVESLYEELLGGPNSTAGPEGWIERASVAEEQLYALEEQVAALTAALAASEARSDSGDSWSGVAVAKQHVYTSTACVHDLHRRCRNDCKFCAARCECGCHQQAPADS